MPQNSVIRAVKSVIGAWLARFLPAMSGMKHDCPNPHCQSARTVKDGHYRRLSDSRRIQRFKCNGCGTTFSSATGAPAYGQKKRRLNSKVLELLSSGVSQNRSARLLRTNRKTIARKLAHLAKVCAHKNRALLENCAPARAIQFDELETIEHTKCKPLSVALAVDADTRRILDFQVSSMPCKGPLAHVSRKKYGHRPDHRGQGLHNLMDNIRPLCASRLELSSDQCPRYASVVAATLQEAPGIAVHYEQTKGARGCVSGQGELKKLGHDPLFSLNHTCAMLRANINRLFRRTWCTTKKSHCLEQHLQIYAYYHNRYLIAS
jgi:transposase-like protein